MVNYWVKNYLNKVNLPITILMAIWAITLIGFIGLLIIDMFGFITKGI